MTINFKTLSILASVTTISLLTGCAGGGMGNSNLAGMAAQNAMGGSPLQAIGNSMMNSMTQNLAASVLNGQIGSQMAPADQSFRLQQLGGMVQSGNFSQPQQWVNPQTGSAMAINPVGQSMFNQNTQQHCQNLQEVVTMPNGQSVTENRVACQNPQTGQWNLVQ